MQRDRTPVITLVKLLKTKMSSHTWILGTYMKKYYIRNGGGVCTKNEIVLSQFSHWDNLLYITHFKHYRDLIDMETNYFSWHFQELSSVEFNIFLQDAFQKCSSQALGRKTLFEKYLIEASPIVILITSKLIQCTYLSTTLSHFTALSNQSEFILFTDCITHKVSPYALAK